MVAQGVRAMKYPSLRGYNAVTCYAPWWLMCELLNFTIHGIEIKLFCYKINSQIIHGEQKLLAHHTHTSIMIINNPYHIIPYFIL